MMRGVYVIFLVLALFFSIYDFLLGNVFEEVIHPSLIFFLVFVMGVMYGVSLFKKSSPLSEREEIKDE